MSDEDTQLEILERLEISPDAAEELKDQYSDPDVGVIRDLTFDGAFYLVRWDDAE